MQPAIQQLVQRVPSHQCAPQLLLQRASQPHMWLAPHQQIQLGQQQPAQFAQFITTQFITASQHNTQVLITGSTCSNIIVYDDDHFQQLTQSAPQQLAQSSTAPQLLASQHLVQRAMQHRMQLTRRQQFQLLAVQLLAMRQFMQSLTAPEQPAQPISSHATVKNGYRRLLSGTHGGSTVKLATHQVRQLTAVSVAELAVATSRSFSLVPSMNALSVMMQSITHTLYNESLVPPATTSSTDPRAAQSTDSKCSIAAADQAHFSVTSIVCNQFKSQGD